MAIRPIKSLVELKDFPRTKQFKSCREVNPSNIFGNLLMAAFEHLLTYCKGQNIKQFFEHVQSQIPKGRVSELQKDYSEAFEDLEELFSKKQLKIFNSMLYDYNFLNFLLALQEIFEFSEGKSSQNENLHIIEHYCKKFMINSLVYYGKDQHFKYCVDDPFVNLTLYINSVGVYILNPVQYKVYNNEIHTNVDESIKEEDFRKNNLLLDEDSEYPESSSRSVYSEKLGVMSPLFGRRSFALSPDNALREREKEVEKRMRQRSRVLKEKRRQNQEIKRMVQSRQLTIEIGRLSEESSLIRNYTEDLQYVHGGAARVSMFSAVEESKNSKSNQDDDYQDILDKERELSILLKQRQEELTKLQATRKQQSEKRTKELESLKTAIQDKQEKRRIEEEKILYQRSVLEFKKLEIEAKIVEKRQIFEKKKEEEVNKLAEQKKVFDEKKIELDRKIAEQRAYAEQVLAERKIPEEQRIQEMKRMAEEKKQAAERQLARATKIYEDRIVSEEYKMRIQIEKDEQKFRQNELKQTLIANINTSLPEKLEKKLQDLQKLVNQKTQEFLKYKSEEEWLKQEARNKEDARIEELKSELQARIEEEKRNLEETQKKVDEEKILIIQKREAEKIEAEKILQGKILDAEKLEAQRIEARKIEAERLEAERIESERLEIEARKIEAERLENEARRSEAERMEIEAQKLLENKVNVEIEKTGNNKWEDVEEFEGSENKKPAAKLAKGKVKQLRSSKPAPRDIQVTEEVPKVSLEEMAKNTVDDVINDLINSDVVRIADEEETQRLALMKQLEKERIELEINRKQQENEKLIKITLELPKDTEEIPEEVPEKVEETPEDTKNLPKHLEESKSFLEKEAEILAEESKIDESEKLADEQIEAEEREIIEDTEEQIKQIVHQQEELEIQDHVADLHHMIDLVKEGGKKLSLAEQRRLSAEATIQRELKKAEERRIAEQKRQEEEYLEMKKQREEKRRAAKLKQDEELRILEEKKLQQIKAKEEAKAELHRKNEEKRKAEEKKLEEFRQEEKRKEDEKRRQEAEKWKLEEDRQKKKEEERKLAEKRKEEEKRIAAEKKKKIEDDKIKAEEDKRKAEQKRLAEEQKRQAKVVEETYEETDNTSYCGGVYCTKCARDLKRSNYVLKCDVCNDKYLRTHQPPPDNPSVTIPQDKSCMNCGVKVVKGEEVHCVRCFLQLKIFGEQASLCSGCVRTDKCYWIDAGDGDPKTMTLCGFCDEPKTKETIIKICKNCGDTICVICLRKNPYVTQGICSHCHNRREPALL